MKKTLSVVIIGITFLALAVSCKKSAEGSVKQPPAVQEIIEPLAGTWVFESVTLKQGNGSELRAMISFIVDQIPGLSAQERKEGIALFENLSDPEIRQLLEYGLDMSRQSLKDSEMKLDNGNFEVSVKGVLSSKGTYIVNNDKITQTTTHINSGAFGLRDLKIGLESRMYTINELKKALNDANPMYTAILDSPMLSTQTQDYSVNGNTLTLTNDFSTSTYVRK